MSKKNRSAFKTKTAKTKTRSTELSDQELQQVSGGHLTVGTHSPEFFRNCVAGAHYETPSPRFAGGTTASLP
jgi:bacteriocin-like protein